MRSWCSAVLSVAAAEPRWPLIATTALKLIALRLVSDSTARPGPLATHVSPTLSFAVLAASTRLANRSQGRVSCRQASLRQAGPLALLGLVAALEAELGIIASFHLASGPYCLLIVRATETCGDLSAQSLAVGFVLLVQTQFGLLPSAGPSSTCQITFAVGVLITAFDVSLSSLVVSVVATFTRAVVVCLAKRQLARGTQALVLIADAAPFALVASAGIVALRYQVGTSSLLDFPLRIPLLIAHPLLSALEAYALVATLGKLAADRTAASTIVSACAAHLLASGFSRRAISTGLNGAVDLALLGAAAVVLAEGPGERQGDSELGEKPDDALPEVTQPRRARWLPAMALVPICVAGVSASMSQRLDVKDHSSPGPHWLSPSFSRVGLPANSSDFSFRDGTRKTLDLVFAYYDEDMDQFNAQLDTILAVPTIRAQQIRVIVYNKGSTSAEELSRTVRHPSTIIKLPNIGRESHTYLAHIVANYDRPYSEGGFADHVGFFQGHMAWYWLADRRLRLFAPETGYLHLAPYAPNVRGLDTTNQQDFPVFRDLFALVTETILPPTPITTAWSAQMIVSSARIRTRSKSKYEALLALLTQPADHWLHGDGAKFGYGHAEWSPANPWLGHSVERLWPVIFFCDDPSVVRGCPNESADRHACQCFDQVVKSSP